MTRRQLFSLAITAPIAAAVGAKPIYRLRHSGDMWQRLELWHRHRRCVWNGPYVSRHPFQLCVRAAKRLSEPVETETQNA